MEPPVKLPSDEMKAKLSGPMPVLIYKTGQWRIVMVLTKTNSRVSSVCIPAGIYQVKGDVDDSLIIQKTTSWVAEVKKDSSEGGPEIHTHQPVSTIVACQVRTFMEDRTIFEIS